MKMKLNIALIICSLLTIGILLFLGFIMWEARDLIFINNHGSFHIHKHQNINTNKLYLFLSLIVTCLILLYGLGKKIENIFNDLADIEDTKKIEDDIKEEKEKVKEENDSTAFVYGGKYRQNLWDIVRICIKENKNTDDYKDFIEKVEKDLVKERKNKTLGEDYRQELWNQINRRAEKAKIASLRPLLNEYFKDLKDFIKNWGVK